MANIILFTFEQWESENAKVIAEAKNNSLKYDPSKRSQMHIAYGKELFKQFPDELEIEVQIAYLLKNMICAQCFEYGNKRTAHRMVRQFSEINGYHINASIEEWVRLSKKIQKTIPKKFVIDNPYFEYDKEKYLTTGSGGGYAVKIEAIPMFCSNDSLQFYNRYIIDWVREHLEKI